MKRSIVLMMMVASLSLSTGCMSRAIKEGIGVATGAKGMWIVNQGQSVPALGAYTRFEVQPFVDQSPLAVPSLINARLPQYVAEQLQEKKIPNEPGGRTLTVRGTYIYYEDASQATDQVFGPFEEVIARVQLVDGGQVVAEAVCVGRSSQTVNMGADKKAQGLAKAIANLIDKHYPKRQ